MRELKNTIKLRGGKSMRKFGLSLVLALALGMMMATAAFAVHSNTGNAAAGQWTSDEFGRAGNQTAPDNGQKYAVKDSNAAAGSFTAALDCAYCHENNTKHTAGPHGGYTTTTNKCMTCHGLHARTENNKAWSDRLLPGTYTVEVCAFCHDLTESDLSPYTSEYMSGKTYADGSAKKVKSAHRIAGLEVYDAPGTNAYDGPYAEDLLNEDVDIPGGDYVTGGAATLNTGAQGKLSAKGFTCDSCHTPHAVVGSTVDPYVGESHVKWGNVTGATQTMYPDKASVGALTVPKANAIRVYLTDRLLKAQLNTTGKFNTTTGRVYERYNSNWCAGCHQGRFASDAGDGEGTIHNHPVSIDPMDANGKPTSHNVEADGYKFTQWATFNAGITDNSGTAITDEASMVASARKQLKEYNATVGGLVDVYPSYYAIEGSGAFPGAKYVRGSAKVASPNTANPSDYNWSPVLFNTASNVVSNKQYAMTSGDALNNNATRPDGFDAIEYDLNGVGKAPSCQQCHGSARDIEDSFANFKAATVATSITAAMNFPHISENKALLVEQGDDFCTNCHGLDNLP